MAAMLVALTPIFALIALGFGLRWLCTDERFWHPIEELTYFVLFPALLVTNISETIITWSLMGPLLITVLAAIAFLGCVLLLVKGWLPVDNAEFTSVMQGSVRFNTYIGVAAAGALYGKAAVAMVAIVAAFTIPLVNFFSVYTLGRYGTNAGNSSSSVVRELARNPLILASLAGLSLSFTGSKVPMFLYPAVDALGKASLPLGLMAVGAGLDFRAIAGKAPSLSATGIIKLAVLPSLIWLGSHVTGLDSMARTVAVLFGALPTAPSAFILARVMGGDHALMAGIITVQTILAALTLPLALGLLT